ncbi:type IV pilus assembly protein PilV [Modicisalibacter muralis]|uniref:Type IV pilus assembly protein PilV n=1 Tax=Modicisalibacter muralis TaxID=119000 RepID=A0A1G9QLA6_9GAMM|nr:type IV pilus modification protein PilV [Halomonas muralis]SDM11789.1 type IV pilus assembly protein PilV [Halomonas muralis]
MTTTMTSHSISHCRCQGFSLIEALIALLVLSIGLLGVAGMQLKALQGAHMAYQRSLANVIAIDAQERLWSRLQPGQACPPVSDVSDDWKKAWFSDGGDGRETLPGGGDSAIETGADGPCSYRVTVDWQETRKEGNEDISPFTYQFSLPGATS